MLDRIRKRIFDILEFPIAGDWVTRVADLFIMSLILLNVVALIVDSVPEVHRAYRFWFGCFELFSIAAFSAEYALRLWTCTTSPKFRRPILGRLRYMATPMALVDLLSVMPFYLAMARIILGVDLRFIRVLRLARLVRVFKLARYMKSVSLIGRVIRERRGELVMTLVFSAILLVLSSSLMYYVENRAQPAKFSSIPATMWWAMETLTTLGYGDVYPVTPLGKFFGAIIALTGIGMFALPTAILGSGFVEAIREEREAKKPAVCPHCGKDITAVTSNQVTSDK